jgi:hypothetical protein
VQDRAYNNNLCLLSYLLSTLCLFTAHPWTSMNLYLPPMLS